MKLLSIAKQSSRLGMTLLEVTIVIIVLLSLISILFIGARTWKRGSDRAANILNIRNVQQVVRAHSNTHALAIGTPLAEADIIGPNRYLGSVISPNSDITYLGKFYSEVPPIGTLYLAPSYVNAVASADFSPVEGSYREW